MGHEMETRDIDAEIGLGCSVEVHMQFVIFQIEELQALATTPQQGVALFHALGSVQRASMLSGCCPLPMHREGLAGSAVVTVASSAGIQLMMNHPGAWMNCKCDVTLKKKHSDMELLPIIT